MSHHTLTVVFLKYLTAAEYVITNLFIDERDSGYKSRQVAEW